MDYKKKLLALLVTIAPYVKDIVEEKIIPWGKKLYYKRMEAVTKKMVVKLGELGEKILSCTDAKKRARHIVGFKLGYAFICAIEPILREAKQVLREIDEEIDKQEEIPF